MKHVLKLLLYAALGFTIAYLVMNSDVRQQLMTGNRWVPIALLVIAVLTTVFAIYKYFQLRSMATVKGSDEDAMEQRKYRKFVDLTLITQFSTVIAVLALGMGAIMETPVWHLLAGMITFITAFIFQLLTPALTKLIYPERSLPDVSDKHYADKLLAISDEGERHIMLNGLYKAYVSTSSLLFIALVVLVVYSVFTGNTQILGMFLIAAILLISNVQYGLSIRNR
ncbi:DUF3169 family protein [Salinicoccus sp. ID82-1]|uniref:DUF3169 family protein n=1 Tax=Salinicoccus sp. ID82-1 TaxID=2820269 RepID=UPI001F1A0FF1|nr:DUF3169 family protein [Salinicoccus sp. ID82-1]MCG1009635.1 DUF3169 family protein [Salinicoccus sp. ID82-1]